MTAASTEDIHAYLDRHQRKELLRFLTCGSVDDGKSTLIGRLLHDTKGIYDDQLAAVKRDSAKHGTTGSGEVDLALLTDGLKAEREQGITIDVAYRYFSTDKRKFIIADTPGHEQYTRNMATGASTCQLAIILIDARHGVMPQTRRHSFIVSLLGIRHLVVAINKMDLVGFSEERYNEIREEYEEFVAKLGVPDVTFIPMSALKGDNVVEKSPAMPWYVGPPLLNHLETVYIASDRNLSEMRFPVQYVLRPNLDFRGFSGTVASGIVRRGDEIVVLPSRRRSKVKSIVAYGGELTEAFCPQAVTITLEDEIDVSRGDMLVHPNAEPHVADRLDATVVWMAEKPLAPGRGYWLKQTTRLVPAEVSAIRYGVDVNTLEKRPVSQLAMNEVGNVCLTLTQPIAFDAYKANPSTGAFILIDRLTNNTVGAGMICEPPDRPTGGDHWAHTPVAGHRVVHQSRIAPVEREGRFGQKGYTVLIYGRPGSGKATLAYLLERKLFDAGRAVTVLYGPDMRQGLSRDLGYSADDRSENLRRSIEAAKLINDAGMIAICAFVAPHDAVRRKAREVVGGERFVEIYLSCPEEVSRVRIGDGPGRSAEFTEEYELPSAADMKIDTAETPIEAAVEQLISFLAQRFQ